LNDLVHVLACGKRQITDVGKHNKAFIKLNDRQIFTVYELGDQINNITHPQKSLSDSSLMKSKWHLFKIKNQSLVKLTF
jgi:hypothetical protein